MSARELQRIEVLTEVVAGRRDVVSGAAVLAVSVRQMHRLLARYRMLGIAASRMSDILYHREQRYVGAQLTLSYDRKQIILERTEVSEELAGQYVELYDFPDRPLEVRWKGHLLPYRIFAKDQRVSHTAIVENKRLGHVLRIVKAQQDTHQAPTVQTNSSKGGYQKRGRRLYGPDYYCSDKKLSAPPSAEAVEMPV